MEKRVGRYRLGPRWVELFLVSGDSGGFISCPPSGITRVEVCWNHDWRESMSVLLHEAIELAITDIRGRFAPSPDYGNENSGYLFSFNHVQFSEAIGRVAMFVHGCLGDFGRAWKKFEKPKPKKRKK